MSSPACADGYDTPAQQREDSTTFMQGARAAPAVTVSSSPRPGQAALRRRATAARRPAEHGVPLAVGAPPASEPPPTAGWTQTVIRVRVSQARAGTSTVTV